jgi:hypothetical protein
MATLIDCLKPYTLGNERVNPLMALTIQIASENLMKAREDVQFWENALRVLRDPRIAAVDAPEAAPRSSSPAVEKEPAPRLYGELKRRVLSVLPEWKDGGDCYSTAGIVKRMEAGGYVFASKTPGISVNEALVNLEKEGLAVIGAKQKGVRFWIKAPPKDQETPEGAKDQQQTPP